MSETERSERLGASKKKTVHKKEKAPPPGGAGLCPVHELEALNLDSSDDSESSGDEVLDTEEEAEQDEEADKYEEERYHPDDHIQSSKKPRRRQLQTALSQVVPSAPPPYETHPKSYSFLPEKVKRKLRLAFPVFEGIEGEQMHAPVEYNQIKELAESVRKYGGTANFTLAQLDRLALNALTPSDWQMVAKAALVSMGQYMEWKALWHEAVQEQARANATALTPEQQLWTFNLLTGQGRFAADQTNCHWGAYPQIANAAIRAWKALSKKGGVGLTISLLKSFKEPRSLSPIL
ncbi:Retroviral nucleocapsid protein Gag containing protein [Cricetulus griseus]|nr:Retroviral nucleocapsid protein Gag containing protein [Cricetulus griseus]